MARASYKRAIEWIAVNDETACTDVEELSALVSVVMVADLWERDPVDVAKDVLRSRRRMWSSDQPASSPT